MAKPRPTLSAENPAAKMSPIGEVHILVYDWKPGRSEVQIRFPPDALPGAPDFATLQPRFQKLIRDEFEDALETFGKYPG